MATVHAMHYPSLIVHHYTSGTGLLDIFKSDSLWATSIHCMGPTPHLKLALNNIGHLFQKAKFGNGMTHTMIPYRDW